MSSFDSARTVLLLDFLAAFLSVVGVLNKVRIDSSSTLSISFSFTATVVLLFDFLVALLALAGVLNKV